MKLEWDFQRGGVGPFKGKVHVWIFSGTHVL